MDWFTTIGAVLLWIGVGMQTSVEWRTRKAMGRKTPFAFSRVFAGILVYVGTGTAYFSLTSERSSMVAVLIVFVVVAALMYLISDRFVRQDPKRQEDLPEQPVIQVSGRPSKSPVPLVLGVLILAVALTSRRATR